MLSAEYKTEFTASLGARHRGVIGEGGEFEFEPQISIGETISNHYSKISKDPFDS